MTDAVTPPNPPPGAHVAGARSESIPDPTLLTIDALRREIAMLENLLNSRIEAEAQLTSERFAAVEALSARDEEQRKEQKADTKTSVDSALAAQKEAAGKMETATAAQLTSLRDNFETSIRAIQSNVADLKDRMTTVESLKQGMNAQRSETRQVSAGAVAVTGVAVTVLLALFTVLSFLAVGA